MNVHRHSVLNADAERSESGLAIIMVALALIPLMAFAAMAVDFGSWYANGNRIHKAADAAALAGVVWLPDETMAANVARATAARNGYDASDASIDIAVTRAGPNALRVKITDNDIPLYLASVFLDDVNIGRSATAEYVEAVPMGSPTNTLGNDPTTGLYGPNDQPFLWLALFGRNTDKSSGDRYHTQTCSSGSAIFCAGGTNEEYDESGYRFTVDVTAVQGVPLNFEVFDPVHHNYGDTCTQTESGFLFGDASDDAFYMTNEDGLGAPNYPPERYENGSSAEGANWCPGDNGLSGAYAMTVIVREPDNTPFNSDDNPVLCWARFGNDHPSDQANFVTKLTSEAGTQPIASGTGPGSGGLAPGVLSYKFRDTFREWATACTDTTPETGQYQVQIRTNAAADPTQTNPAINTGGRNRFSMRAGFGTEGVNASYASGVSFSADGRLPLFVNRPGGDDVESQFYIARVTPEYAGQTLQLDVYDLTDGSHLDIAFRPDPSDATVNYTQFTNCTMIVFLKAGGTANLNDTNCKATSSANNFNPGGLRNGQGNGAAISAFITIPADWTCNDSDPTACWIKAFMTFDGNPADTTTWSASLTGDPVHLID